MRIPSQYIDLILAGDDDSASLMLDSAWVDLHDDDGKTLFIHSIEQGLPKLFSILLEHKCNINLAELSTQRTPLMFACMKDKFGFLAELMNHKELILDSVDSEGNNAYFYAAFWGNLSALVQLENVVPNLAHAPNRREEIPIEYTIREHRNEAFSLFLALGEIPENKIADLMHLSAEMGVWVQAKSIIEKYPNAIRSLKEGFTPIHRAVISGNIAWVKEALSQKAYSVNEQDTFENTLLHYATALSFDEIIRFLLANGADSSILNNENKTALEYATEEEVKALFD